MQDLSFAQIILLLLVVAWSALWKGIALYQAARNSQKYWFVALLVVNSLGILEVCYLVFWQKKKKA